MGYKNRELEVKLDLVDGQGYAATCAFVESVVQKLSPVYTVTDDMVIGNATDLYWNAPRAGIGDFVRLRQTSKGAQITLKATDKGNNVDRVEIDLEVDDYKQAKALMFALHGDPKAKVTKAYQVYFLENNHTNISVYQVQKDKRVFVEVEATSRKRLKQIIRALMADSDPKWSWNWIRSSIYDMFVCDKTPKKGDILEFLNE